MGKQGLYIGLPLIEIDLFQRILSMKKSMFVSIFRVQNVS